MATGRRARHRSRRRRRRLTPGRLSIGALLVLALLYFAFTRIFFDPFEEAQKPFARLVPWDVDLFVQREGLRHDVSTFPRLREVDRLLGSSAWREVAATAWYGSLGWPQSVERWVEEIRGRLTDAPLDVVEDVLGHELAVVGRDVAAEGRYALLARLSAKGKLAVDSLGKIGGVFDRVFPGATRETRADPDVAAARYEAASLPDGGQLFWSRVTDLLVLSDDEELLREVLRVVATESERSVGLSRLYLDHLPESGGSPENRFSAAAILDVGALLPGLGLRPSAEERSEHAVANFVPRVLDLSLLRDGAGRLELEGGRAHLRLHADLDTGRAAADRGGLLGQPAQPSYERLRDALAWFPDGTAAVLSVDVDLRRLLRAVVDGFAPELRQLVDGTLRNVGRYNAVWPSDNVLVLIDRLDAAFGGRVTVAVRTLDHQVPPGMQPLPALAFILPVEDVRVWNEIEAALLNANPILPIDGKSMWQSEEGGVGTRKWAAVAGAPMEDVCWVVLDQRTFVIGTDEDFVAHIVEVYIKKRTETLVSRADTRQLLEELRRPEGRRLGQANLVAWADAQKVGQLLDPYADWLGDLATKTDLAVVRARRGKELVAQHWPEWRGREEALPDDIEAELDARLDEDIAAAERRRVQEEVPAWALSWRERFAWMKLTKGAVLTLRWADREADLEVHLASVMAR